MLPPGTIVRRATLDDLETLRGLWRECRLAEYDLEKRFTEFQVATDAHGWILGALGLQFNGHHGHLHGVSIRRRDLESDLLAALWERQLAVANQRAAYRLWTREHEPFWATAGFTRPTVSEQASMPPAFGDSDHWRTLKLRDEPLKLIAAEEQLEAYLELERLKTERLLRRGRFLKLAATTFAAVLFFIVLGALFLLLRNNRRSAPRRLPQP